MPIGKTRTRWAIMVAAAIVPIAGGVVWNYYPRKSVPSTELASNIIQTRSYTGTVKWFNAVKGFGFIQPDDGSKDVFVHISAVERANLRPLQVGQRIQYELVPGRLGKSTAENLKIIEYDDPKSLEEALEIIERLKSELRTARGIIKIPPGGTNGSKNEISTTPRPDSVILDS